MRRRVKTDRPKRFGLPLGLTRDERLQVLLPGFAYWDRFKQRVRGIPVETPVELPRGTSERASVSSFGGPVGEPSEGAAETAAGLPPGATPRTGGVYTTRPRSRRGRLPSHRQAGVFLLELGLALMLALIAATWAGAHVMQAVRDGQAEATGNYLLAIKGAMDGAIAGNFHAYARGLPLANADGSPRFADPMVPTLAELRTLGHLPNSFPNTTPAGQSVLIQVRRDATRCPGVGCRVEALIHTSTAFRGASGDIDYQAAALAVSAMEGWGGAAWFDQPGKIRGTAFTQDNPVSSSAGGIVGVMAMLDTSMWNQFVRMGDDRDPALQGNLSVVGATSTQRLGIRESVEPNSACIPTNFANAANPALTPVSLTDNVEYAKTTTGGLATCVGGAWRSIAVVAQLGAACGTSAYPEGTTGVDVTGTGLLCRDGTWSSLSQWLSREVRMASYLIPAALSGAKTNNTLPKPTCGSSGGVPGTPFLEVVPQSIQNRGAFTLVGTRNGDNISVSGTMTLDPTNFPASSVGANWSVGVPPNSQAFVHTFCRYS